MIDKSRELALKIIVEINEDNAYSNITLNKYINENKNKLNEKDISFISELVYGTTNFKLSLDEIIKKYSKIKINKISKWILNILRLGIYQIIFLDKVPKSAAVNESVNLAKRYGHKASSNFVNAILRKVSKEDYEELQNIDDNIQKISKTTSTPEWLVKEIEETWGINDTEEICKSFNIRPKINIRINKLKILPEDFIKILEENNIKYEILSQDMPEFLQIENLRNIQDIKYFKEGYFTIQDISAGFAAKLLEPKEGQIVLDACSAPGGKTTYLAELMNNKGEIFAWDIHEHRINLIEENAKRLNIDIIKTEIRDSSIFKDEYTEKFDKILLDVPCLGIGVIRRKPDIKWQRKLEDIKEISDLQFKILDNCSKYLKIGGEIVYSTCSILKEENEDIIYKFLEKNRNFIIEKNGKNSIKFFERYYNKDGYFKIKPSEKNDGFFACKVVKK